MGYEKTPKRVLFRPLVVKPRATKMISKKQLLAIVLLGLICVTKSVHAGSLIYAQPDGFSILNLENEGDHLVAFVTVPQNTMLNAGSLFVFTGGQAHCVSPATHYDLYLKLSDDPTFTGGSEVQTSTLQYTCGNGFQTNATTSVDFQMYVGTKYYLDINVAFADALSVNSASTTMASGWIFNNATSTEGTNYDLYRLEGIASSTSALSEQQTLDVGQYCNVLSGFSPQNCVLALFLVSGSQGGDLASALQNAVLTKVPFGYATRIVSLLSTTTTADIPSATLHLNGNVPSALQGTTTIMNTMDAINGATAILTTQIDDGSGHNLWDVTMPYFKKIVYLLLALLIIRDILGVEFISKNQFGTHGALSDTNSGDDSYRLKEYLYNHRR